MQSIISLLSPSLIFFLLLGWHSQCDLSPEGGGERGVLWISSDRDDLRIFWGFKFSVSGFFGVSKTISRFVIVPAYPGCVVPLEIFMAGKFSMGFLGFKFWSRDFWGFCLKLAGFVWVLIFAPIRSIHHLTSGVPPWGCKP